MKARVDRFGVRRELQLAHRAGHHRHDALSVHDVDEVHPEQIENRRHHIDGADRIRDPTAAQRVVRREDHQWNVEHRFVDEEPVRALAVVAQALSMIAKHDDDRAVEQLFRLEECADPRDLRVDERDLAQVRSIGKSCSVRLGRRVRRVRIIEMHPAEESQRLDRLEPCERAVGHFVRGPLDFAERRRLELAQVEIPVRSDRAPEDVVRRWLIRRLECAEQAVPDRGADAEVHDLSMVMEVTSDIALRSSVSLTRSIRIAVRSHSAYAIFSSVDTRRKWSGSRRFCSSR